MSHIHFVHIYSLREEDGPFAVEEFVEVDVAMCSFGLEVRRWEKR